MAILWDDHELFKILNSRCKDIKKVVISLRGKKKKGSEIEADDEDDIALYNSCLKIEVMATAMPSVARAAEIF